MSAAMELAHLGITANVVHPAVTDTGWVDQGVRKMVEEDPLMVHVAQSSEVAEVIGWLVSKEAMLMTGNVIHLR